MNTVKIGLFILAGFLLGLAAGLTRVPPITVTTFEPAAIQAPGPDWVDQPADEQLVQIQS